MIGVDQVEKLVTVLPEVAATERYGQQSWAVAGKVFAWVRPFSKADLKRFGAEPVPDGPILAVRTADLAEKEAVLAERRPGFFTIAHFDGYAAVLIDLSRARLQQVREAVVDGWLAMAPARLAEQHAGRLTGS